MNEPRNFYDYRQIQELLLTIRSGEPYTPLTDEETEILLQLALQHTRAKVILNTLYGTMYGRVALADAQQKLRAYKCHTKAIESHLTGVRLYRIPFTNIYLTKDKRRIVRALEIARFKP